MILDTDIRQQLLITSGKNIYLFTDSIYHHSTHTKLTANLWLCQKVIIQKSGHYALSGELLHYICLHDLLLGSGFTHEHIRIFLNAYGEHYYVESNHIKLVQAINNNQYPPYTQMTLLSANQLNKPHILVHKLIHSDVCNLLVPCCSASFWQCIVSVFIQLTTAYKPEHPQYSYLVDKYCDLVQLLAPYFILPINQLSNSNNTIFNINRNFWQSVTNKLPVLMYPISEIL